MPWLNPAVINATRNFRQPHKVGMHTTDTCAIYWVHTSFSPYIVCLIEGLNRLLARRSLSIELPRNFILGLLLEIEATFTNEGI